MERLNPADEYRSRRARWQAAEQKAARESIRLGNVRLVVALAAAAIAWAAFFNGWLAPWWLLAPLATFGALVVVHERVAARQSFAHRAVTYYERALRRADGDWVGGGTQGIELGDSAHIYAGDLDVFGRGSLFELISIARTAAGEACLADWLKHAASPVEVAERQAAVEELRNAVDLREQLALAGEEIRANVHAEAITRWGAAAPVAVFPHARLVTAVCGAAALITFAGFMTHLWGMTPFITACAASLIAGFLLRAAVGRIAAAVEEPARDLGVLSHLLRRLEREQFQAPLLERLRGQLATSGRPASDRIRQLGRWVELLDSADHFVLRLIGPPLGWKPQSALAVEAWRRESGADIGRWIHAVAELEALSSLASFAFEHPAAVFPTLEPAGPLFEARALLHPLIDAARCVANDVSISSQQRLLIVSGSNMSGKSTLLRAVGLNAALAWAGAPVTADALRISRLAVGASIRITDSLTDGKSRFYAEITRLRQIVDLAEQQPVLFLLDELLSGTNSHDRLIGAEAVIRALLERGAVGFVTTHDLALTRIQAEFETATVNVHFEDHLENGRISFDYRLRPGIVERSNALELMRAVGLTR